MTIRTLKHIVPPSMRTMLKKPIQYVSGRSRILPDYLIIGVQKAATTSLYFYLRQHPDIASVRKKEIHFFDENYFRGIRWYRSFFPLITSKIQRQLRGRKLIAGEASPYYIAHPLAAQRIAKDIPSAKLIVLLRNPVNRAYSEYQMRVRQGIETLSFEDAIAKENERTAGEVEKLIANPSYSSLPHRHYSYIARSIYADQLTHWFKYFPRDQFLIIQSEALLKSSETVMSEIFSFLEVPVVKVKSDELYHHIPYESLSPELRTRLTEFFRPHNERLYQLINASWRWEDDK
jgi:hypothetical protein